MPYNRDQLLIKDLRIDSFAGIYDFEKEKKQPLLFNLVIDVETNLGRALELIEDLVSYERIVLDIEEIVARKHYDLLEVLAEIVAAHCLSFERVHSVDLTIEKPEIMPQTKSVGIRVVRTK